MLIKKFFVIFTFAAVLLSLSCFASAGSLSISSSSITQGSSATVSVGSGNYRCFLSFYSDSSNNAVSVVKLGSGSSCSGPISFSNVFSANEFPAGDYTAYLFSLDSSSWVTYKFKVVSSVSPTPPSPSCSPASNPTFAGLCMDKGYQCGTVDNGTCGKISCGGCSSGDSCNINTHQCETCIPITCSREGYQCGNMPNGCSGQLYCGFCPSGETCSINYDSYFKCVPSTSSSSSASTSNQDIPPVGSNQKDMSLYSSKETFLMSDTNWQDVLPMVSVTTWTDSSGNVHKYPSLIWHNDSLTWETHYEKLPINTSIYSSEGDIIYYSPDFSYEISAYNISSGKITQILAEPLSINAISASGNYIIFDEYLSSKGIYNLYLYNLVSKTKKLIFSGTPSNFFVKGDYVSWISVDQKKPKDYDVFLYNISSGNEFKIAEEIPMASLALSNRFVVWSSRAYSSSSEISVYDIESGKIKKIYQDYPVTGMSVSGDNLVFSEIQPMKNVLMLYNLSDNHLSTLFSGRSPSYYIDPVISGDKIFWFNYPSGYSDAKILSYDISTGIETSLLNVSEPISGDLHLLGDNPLFYVFWGNSLFLYNSSVNNIHHSVSYESSSIIHFINEYKPDNLTIVGSTPQDLDNQLVAAPSLGAGLQQSQIQRIQTADYLDYWKSFDLVVYVADNYTEALLASTYASLINAPLIIQGSSIDDAKVFSGRSVICVGDVSPAGSSCSESYNLQQLRNRYVQETNTKDIILVNPNDWHIGETSGSVILTNHVYSLQVKKLFYKNSLVAPFLASAKHELLFSVEPISSPDVESLLKPELLELGAKYLTIMASPYVIPYRAYNFSTVFFIYKSLDQTVYADENGNGHPDVYTGRVMGFTPSDVSGYVARDLFYSDLPRTNNMIFMASSFPDMIANSNYIAARFRDIGYNVVNLSSRIVGYPFNPADWGNQGLISYMDHGSQEDSGVNSLEIPQLNNSLIFADACSTCSSLNLDSFCNVAIRNGAIAFFGAVSVGFSGNDIYHETMNGIYYQGLSLGEAFTDAYRYAGLLNGPNDNFDYGISFMTSLVGDPTFKLNPTYKFSKYLCAPQVYESCDGIDNNCNGFVDELTYNSCPTNVGNGPTVSVISPKNEGTYTGKTITLNISAMANKFGGTVSYNFVPYCLYSLDDNTFTAINGEGGIYFTSEFSSLTNGVHTLKVSCDDSSGDVTNVSTTFTVAPSCTPATCSSLGKQCGSASDGCGGTLNCGTCSSGYSCNSNGQCIAQASPPAPTCRPNGKWVGPFSGWCCTGKANWLGICSDCQPADKFVWWNKNNCCSGQINRFGFCK